MNHKYLEYLKEILAESCFLTVKSAFPTRKFCPGKVIIFLMNFKKCIFLPYETENLNFHFPQ